MNKKYTPITIAEAFALLAVSCPTKEEFRLRDSGDCAGVERRLEGAIAGAYPFRDEGGTHWKWCDRITFESPIAKGHNPLNLTEEQVGVADGWRLLTADELRMLHKSDRGIVAGADYWSPGGGNPWLTNDSFFVPILGKTTVFRTKHPEGYYLPKPKIAEGFNPHGLTVEQVGEGYRLLTEDELRGGPAKEGIEFWYEWQGGSWIKDYGYVSLEAEGKWTFRTQKPAGYFLPKVPRYVPWTFETAPKGLVFIRQNGLTSIELVVVWDGTGLRMGTNHHCSWTSLMSCFEHSLDGGKTWSPAATEVRT